MAAAFSLDQPRLAQGWHAVSLPIMPVKGFGTIRRLAFGLFGTRNPAWPIREAPHRRAPIKPLGIGQPSDTQHVPLLPIGGYGRQALDPADYST